MNSFTSRRFREMYAALPEQVRPRAREKVGMGRRPTLEDLFRRDWERNPEQFRKEAMDHPTDRLSGHESRHRVAAGRKIPAATNPASGRVPEQSDSTTEQLARIGTPVFRLFLTGTSRLRLPPRAPRRTSGKPGHRSDSPQFGESSGPAMIGGLGRGGRGLVPSLKLWFPCFISDDPTATGQGPPEEGPSTVPLLSTFQTLLSFLM